MNVNFLQFLLFVGLLSAGFTLVSAHAACDQEELCEAQALVDEIVDEIVEQHVVIESNWKALYSASNRHTLAWLYEQAKSLIDVVDRYLRIGTLESRLLVAYNKLSAVRIVLHSEHLRCYCNDEIQLSAGF